MGIWAAGSRWCWIPWSLDPRLGLEVGLGFRDGYGIGEHPFSISLRSLLGLGVDEREMGLLMGFI